MFSIPKEYKYIAPTLQQLFKQIENDNNIQWLFPHDLLTRETHLKYQPHFLKLLDTITVGYILSSMFRQLLIKKVSK